MWTFPSFRLNCQCQNPNRCLLYFKTAPTKGGLRLNIFRRRQITCHFKPRASDTPSWTIRDGAAGRRAEVCVFWDCLCSLERCVKSIRLTCECSDIPWSHFICCGWKQSCGIFLICFHFLISWVYQQGLQRVNTCQSQCRNIVLHWSRAAML